MTDQTTHMAPCCGGMPSLLISHPSGRENEWNYVLDVVLKEFLGLTYVSAPGDQEDVQISLVGHPNGNRLHIVSVLLNSSPQAWLTERSLPHRPLAYTLADEQLSGRKATNTRIPILYGRPNAQGRYIDRESRPAFLGVDIFGAVFFMLTRYEEMIPVDRGRHDRFPTSSAVTYQEGLHRRPVVNEYVELLWSAIEMVWPGLHRKPRQRRVLLTHDVDSPTSKSWPARTVVKQAFVDIAVRRDPVLAIKRGLSKTASSMLDQSPHWDVLDRFDFMMGSAEQFGWKAAFYFIPSKSPLPRDGNYDITQPGIRALLKRITTRGHEIGYQASFRTHGNPDFLQREIGILRQVCAEEGIDGPVKGGRNHFLKWKNPQTWQDWSDAGLTYDSTLGYVDEIGFRCGCCYEYPVFNVITRQRLPLWERPLTIMDIALARACLGNPDRAFDAIVHLSRICKQFNGDLVLLWHNTSLVSHAEQSLYLNILAALA